MSRITISFSTLVISLVALVPMANFAADANASDLRSIEDQTPAVIMLPSKTTTTEVAAELESAPNESANETAPDADILDTSEEAKAPVAEEAKIAAPPADSAKIESAPIAVEIAPVETKKNDAAPPVIETTKTDAAIAAPAAETAPTAPAKSAEQLITTQSPTLNTAPNETPKLEAKPVEAMAKPGVVPPVEETIVVPAGKPIVEPVLIQKTTPVSSIASLKTDADYSTWFCHKVGGIREFQLKTGERVDCQTKDYSVEVEFAAKYKEAIGQAETYAAFSGKKAGVALVISTPDDLKYYERMKEVIRARKLDLHVWKILPEARQAKALPRAKASDFI